MDKDKQAPVEVRGEVMKRVAESVATYRGDIRVLESAVGAYILGQSFGWKSLYVVHSHRTLKRYAQILGFKTLEELRDSMPFEGPHTGKMVIFKVIKNVTEFWNLITGKADLPEATTRNRATVT